MQSEITMYETQKKKMEGLCDEHNLTFRFRKEEYPITFTIRPLQGMDVQMDMLEHVEEEGYTSPGASMTWTFADGNLTTKVSGGTFTISKTLRTKIESVLIKMITYWQEYFFRDVMERDALQKGAMPVIDESEDPDFPEDDEDYSPPDADEFNLPEDEEPVNEEDLKQAAQIVRMENKATVTLLQRRMHIGYHYASRLIDELEAQEIVGPFSGSSPREVLPYDEPDDEEEEDDAEEG